MPALMTDSDIIDLLGGTASLARRLRISTASVSEMRKNGIPEGRKIELGADIERATHGLTRRWHLRPNDWFRIWPELVGSEDAPEVPEEGGAELAPSAVDDRRHNTLETTNGREPAEAALWPLKEERRVGDRRHHDTPGDDDGADLKPVGAS
jgi:DNA-binding transcriptional regulator YdaS (Cro superfamily)